MTFNNTYTFQIVASANSTVTYNITTTESNLRLNTTTGTFTWTVNKWQNITMEFFAQNSKGAVSSFRPTIFLCYCENNGICDYSQENVLSNEIDRYLRHHACKCQPGFQGAFCEKEKDVCNPNPCYSGVNCTKVSNIASCGSCPDGYIGDGFQCYGMSYIVLLSLYIKGNPKTFPL